MSAAVFAACVAATVPAEAQGRGLDRVRVDLVAVADSQEYFVYRYRS